MMDFESILEIFHLTLRLGMTILPDNSVNQPETLEKIVKYTIPKSS